MVANSNIMDKALMENSAVVVNNLVLTSTTVVAAKDQLCCNLRGETILLNLNSGKYYGFDPVGSRIWELLQEPTVVSDILEALLKEFEVECQQAEKDLLHFLRELASQGLLEVRLESVD